MPQYAKDWKDDFEAYTDPQQGDLRLRRKRSNVAEDGEYVRTPWYLFDAAPNNHPFIRDGSDPLGPNAPPSFVNLNSEQGRAWAQNARAQREAWRDPDRYRAETF